MAETKSAFKCPACGSEEISRANKETGRIGYLMLLIGLFLIVIKGMHPYSLGGLLLIIIAVVLIFKTGKEFSCDQCQARWS